MKDKTHALAKIFKALSDPTRLKILKVLMSHKHSVCVGMIAQKVGISQPAVSQHLRILKNVGILEAHRAGFHVHYIFDPNILHQHKILIDELFVAAFKCCHDKQCNGCCSGDDD